PDALGIAFETGQITQHPLTQPGAAAGCRHCGFKQLWQLPLKPFANRELTEVPERRITHVVHQAGHLDEALDWPLQTIQTEIHSPLAQLLVQRTDDEATGLLDF